MTAGPCVYGDGWADPAVIVAEWECDTTSCVVQYAHPGYAARHCLAPVSGPDEERSGPDGAGM